MDPLSLRSHLAAPLDRRRFLQGAGLTLAASSPVFLAACGSDGTTDPDIDEANDLKVVQSALVLEHSMVAAYTKVLTLLDPAAKALGDRILAQEESHATGLATVIGDLAGTPVEPKSQAQYDEILGLAKLTNQAQALAFASDIEQMAIFSYTDAIPSLTIGDLRSTFTSLATAEAEHDSVLAGIPGGPDPAKQVPSAYVTGAKPTLELS